MNNWIKTNNELPPKGKWVLVLTNEFWQDKKYCEVACYQGIRENTEYTYDENKKKFVPKKYYYHAWTSGHGDIFHNPYAWQPLPSNIILNENELKKI